MHVLLTTTSRAADIPEDTDVRHLVDAMVDTSDLIPLATPEKVDVTVDTRDGIDAGEPEDDLAQRLCVGYYYYDARSKIIHNQRDCQRIDDTDNIHEYAKQRCTDLCGPCGEVVRLSVKRRIHSVDCKCLFDFEEWADLCGSCMEWW